MIYYNKEENKFYTGGSLFLRLEDGSICCGIPTQKQLSECGYEEYVEPTTKSATQQDMKKQRMEEILSELLATDHLALEAFEGEDMSEHPNWKEERAALRREYRQLEKEVTDEVVSHK